MNRLASLCAAAILVAAFGPAQSFAYDGGGGALPDSVVAPKNCPAAAVASRQRQLNKAEERLAKLQGRTVTRAEYNAAKSKVEIAKERLAKAKAGRC